MVDAIGNRVIDNPVYLLRLLSDNAAVKKNFDFLALSAVETFFPISKKRIKQIFKRVIEFYSSDHSHIAYLSKPMVKTSTIQDIKFSSISMVMHFICTCQSYSIRIISSVRDVIFHIKR